MLDEEILARVKSWPLSSFTPEATFPQRTAAHRFYTKDPVINKDAVASRCWLASIVQTFAAETDMFVVTQNMKLLHPDRSVLYQRMKAVLNPFVIDIALDVAELVQQSAIESTDNLETMKRVLVACTGEDKQENQPIRAFHDDLRRLVLLVASYIDPHHPSLSRCIHDTASVVFEEDFLLASGKMGAPFHIDSLLAQQLSLPTHARTIRVRLPSAQYVFNPESIRISAHTYSVRVTIAQPSNGGHCTVLTDRGERIDSHSDVHGKDLRDRVKGTHVQDADAVFLLLTRN